MRFHIHRDPNWQLVGCHHYEICQRCGAVRVSRAYHNADGPTAPGWPSLVDGHGQSVWVSNWVKSTGIQTYPEERMR